jgi:hypothetical protein
MRTSLTPGRNGSAPDKAHSVPLLAPQYNPSEAHPLCKSGRTLAQDIRAFAPGPARAIDHQTATVEQFALLASEARLAARAELDAHGTHLHDQALVILERQPRLLDERKQLLPECRVARQAFTRAAAALNLVFDPNTVTEQTILAALRPPPNVTPIFSPVPVPGELSQRRQIWDTLTLEFSVLCGGIPLGLAVGTLTGLVLFSDLQSLTDGSPVQWTRLALSWAVGVGIHRLFLREAAEIGKARATEKYQGYATTLPEEVKFRRDVRFGLAKLLLFWVLLAALEGIGLYLMSKELMFVNSDANGEGGFPWIAFPVIGAAISGGIMGIGYWKAFLDGCRTLAKDWPRQPEAPRTPAPSLSEREIALRQSLMSAAGELIALNHRGAEIQTRLREDAASLAELPQISGEALQRIRDAEAHEEREAKRLRELLEYTAKRMGRLGVNLDMDDVEIPTKIVVFPFQNLWLNLRGKKSDHWPTP